MPTRLPSGNWRVQARRVIDGRPERKSFTAPNKKDALIAAAAWQEEAEKASALPLAEAVRQYIDSLDGVRSPATVRGYKVILNILLRDPIGEIPVAELTKKDVADAVQRWSKAVAPKTVRNRHGLISAALKQFRPALVLRTPLPEARKKEINVPTDEDIRSLMAQTAGTVLEVPVILGAFAGMRRGEVAALRGEDVFNGYIHVRRTSVVKYGGEVVQKDPKTAAGARRVPLPKMLKLPEEGFVCHTTPRALTSAWLRLQRRRAAEGLPVFRFHDLRHYCASRMHALGVPDAYIMQWLGWSSDHVLKSIYRHALPDEEARQAAKIRAFLTSWHTKRHTHKKSPRKNVGL